MSKVNDGLKKAQQAFENGLATVKKEGEKKIEQAQAAVNQVSNLIKEAQADLKKATDAFNQGSQQLNKAVNDLRATVSKQQANLKNVK